MYVIHEWLERYEVNSKGHAATSDKDLRAGPLKYVRLKVHGHSQSNGYRRLLGIAQGRAMEVFGIFCKLLEIAGDSGAGQRGVLRVERDGSPANIDDLAFLLSVSKSKVEYAVKVLCDKRLCWLANSESSNPAGILGSPGQYNTIQDNSNQVKVKAKQSKSMDLEGFGGFWAEYPKKKSKQDARVAWKKIGPELKEVILEAVRKHKQTHDWVKENGQFVPNAATWLNGRRWEDEILDTDLEVNHGNQRKADGTTGDEIPYAGAKKSLPVLGGGQGL